MSKSKLLTENDLMILAKKYRKATGKTRAAIARELGVARPTIVQAEENPEQSLTKLRIRIIERYSTLKVNGPWFNVG